MDVLTLAGFLGLVCTKLVDTIKHAAAKKVPAWVSVLLSLAFGIGFALLLQLNVLPRLGYVDLQNWRGVLATGFIIGGLGSGFYEALDVVSTKTSQIKKAAGVRRGQE